MRLQALEGWRGLIALLVVLFHLYVLHAFFLHEWLRYLAPVLEFFFIVSGFVMALGFAEKVKDAPSFWSFVIRRAGRVWPLHLSMLALMGLIPLTRFVMGGDPFWGKLSLDALWRNILLIQTWTPEHAFSWNFPAWTLSAEIFAYLLMAFIVLVANREITRWVLGLAVITVAGAYFLNAMSLTEDYNVASVSRGVTGFFIGFLLFHAWRRAPLKNARLANVLEVLGVVGFVGILIWRPEGPAYFACHAVYAFMIYVYASDLGFCSRIMSLPPLLWLGRVSFSVSMLHGVIATMITLGAIELQERLGWAIMDEVEAPNSGLTQVVNLPEPWMNNALALVYIAVVLIGGRFVFQYIEDPSRKYFSNLSRRLQPAKSAEPQAAPSTVTPA